MNFLHCNFAKQRWHLVLFSVALTWKSVLPFFFFFYTQAREELSRYTFYVTGKWLQIDTDCRKDSIAALKNKNKNKKMYVLMMHSLELWSSLKYKGSCIPCFFTEPNAVMSTKWLWNPRALYSMRVTYFTNVLVSISD